MRPHNAIIAAALCLIPLVGCDRPATPLRYVVLSGVVSACSFDTGELAVTVVRGSGRTAREETIDCVVTKDSEIYVNGRFAQFAEIALTDAVTLVGYLDTNPRSSRFVVSYAYFEHGAAASAGGPNADSALSSPSIQE